MRKPPNLVKRTDTFPINFQSDSQVLNLQVKLEDNSSFTMVEDGASGHSLGIQIKLENDDNVIDTELVTESSQLDIDVDLEKNSNFFLTDLQSVQQIASIQPDWLQEDDTKHDFIKNKDVAEQFRPIFVNGQKFLDESRSSGPLNIVGTNGVLVSINNGNLLVSGEQPDPEIEICCETIKKVYNQNYLMNENGDYIVDENGQKIPVGPATGLLVDEVARATAEEINIKDRITSLFNMEKDENDNPKYNGEIVDYVYDSLQNSLPIATTKKVGAVRASEEVNGIFVNPENGTMEVNFISTDKLVQGDKELILNGGDTILYTN